MVPKGDKDITFVETKTEDKRGRFDRNLATEAFAD